MIFTPQEPQCRIQRNISDCYFVPLNINNRDTPHKALQFKSKSGHSTAVRAGGYSIAEAVACGVQRVWGKQSVPLNSTMVAAEG